MIGLEALTRPQEKKVETFFSEVRQSDNLLELDRRCRTSPWADSAISPNSWPRSHCCF
jgi:hypothetical protein